MPPIGGRFQPIGTIEASQERPRRTSCPLLRLCMNMVGGHLKESNPMVSLSEFEDSTAPIIVTLDKEVDESTPDEGPLNIGFRILSWGAHYRPVPTVCWWENTGRQLQCGDVLPEDMAAAQETAIEAITDGLAERVIKTAREGYKPVYPS